MIYAFGRIPRHRNDDLRNFIKNNDGLFVLPEGFIDIYNFPADDLAGLTRDSERSIVAGTGPCVFNNDEKAVMFSDGEQIPIAYHNTLQGMFVDNFPSMVEIRVCSDITLPYRDEDFDMLLHISSGSTIVDSFHRRHISQDMQSKLVVSSSYNEGKILVGGKNIGHVGETREGIRYAYLDSLQRYL